MVSKTMLDNEPPGELSLIVKLSSGDIYRGSLLNGSKSSMFWIGAIIAGSAVAIVLGGDNPYQWIVAGWTAAIYVFVTPFSAVRAHSKNPGVRSPIIYGFSEAGISAKFSNGALMTDWSPVIGAFESARYLLIRMQRGGFHLVPKVQIQTDDLVKLKQILREKLGKKARV